MRARGDATVDIVGAIPARLAWRDGNQYGSIRPGRALRVSVRSLETHQKARGLPFALCRAPPPPPANWTPFLSGPRRPQITRACGVGEQPYAPMRFGFLQLHAHLRRVSPTLPFFHPPLSASLSLSLLHSSFCSPSLHFSPSFLPLALSPLSCHLGFQERGFLQLVGTHLLGFISSLISFCMIRCIERLGSRGHWVCGVSST